MRARSAGTGRAIRDLVSALARRDRGLAFTVLASEPELFREVQAMPHWRVEGCPGSEGGNLKKAWFTQFRLPGLVRDLEGDLLHCLQFLAPLRCPCPVAVMVHDLAWRRYPETIERPRRFYYRWLVPRTLAAAAAITTNSQATADETVEFYPSTTRKIRVTPLGTPTWTAEQSSVAGQGRESSARPFFLFVGTLEPRKNLPRLLEAYGSFRTKALAEGREPSGIPDLVFVGGKGWGDSSLRSLLDRGRKEGWLVVKDYCAGAELWTLYRSALALVFPSLHEGFGLPILEAMAAGLPVLTSDRGGTREVAGGNALLVDPTNTEDVAAGLRVMAFEPAVRQRLGEEGPRHAARWSWDRTADLTEAVYRELLETGPDK